MIRSEVFESTVPATIVFTDLAIDVEFNVEGHVDHIFPDQSQFYKIEIENVLTKDPDLECVVQDLILENMDKIYDVFINDIQNIANESFNEPYRIDIHKSVKDRV